VEHGAGEAYGGELGVGDFDPFRVCVLVEAGVDVESGACWCGADEVDDDFEAGEGCAAPVLGDEAEPAVLDCVPFAGAGREMAHLDSETGLACELLQLGPPEAGAVAVTAAAVGGDREGRRVRVAR
jgi:hypothetical protein